MLILSRDETEALLDPDALVEAIARAMADLSAGVACMPARIAAFVPEQDGFLAAMPAFLPSLGALTTKLVSVFPRNAQRGLATHLAIVAVFDPATGTPVALLDGASITAARTAAGSALATRLLAGPQASVAAILGTGVQARSHARAVARVRRLTELRVAGRDPAKAAVLANELTRTLGLPVRPCRAYQDAMAGAHIVCAATNSPEPVVRREWLSAGTHVNSVGFNPRGVEVDGRTVADSLLVVESRAAVLAPFPAGSNDVQWPIRDGLITAGHIHAEVGELVMGVKPGRASPEQITLYKSVGVAVEDAAAAALVLEAARARGAGIEVKI